MPNWNDPAWRQAQGARIGEQGAGSLWGPMLARSLLPTTMPDDRFGGSTPSSTPDPAGRNPILSGLGQTVTGGPSGLAAGVGRYRPPTAAPAAGTFQSSLFNGLMGRMNIPTGGLAPQQAARGAADGRSFGANPAANQMLAGALPGFRGDFGGGRFNAYMQTASPGEQEIAGNILRALGQPDRISWGMPAPMPAPGPAVAPSALPGPAVQPALDPNDWRNAVLPGGQGPGE